MTTRTVLDPTLSYTRCTELLCTVQKCSVNHDYLIIYMASSIFNYILRQFSWFQSCVDSKHDTYFMSNTTTDPVCTCVWPNFSLYFYSNWETATVSQAHMLPLSMHLLCVIYSVQLATGKGSSEDLKSTFLYIIGSKLNNADFNHIIQVVWYIYLCLV